MNKINNEKRKKVKLKAKKPKQYPSFNEQHQRFTTYLEKDIYKKIRQLKDNRYIKTYTEFVNDALRDYLQEHF